MTCLFTHDDLDGVGCAIVARLAFPDDLVVRYCSYKSINSEINFFLDQLQEPVKIRLEATLQFHIGHLRQ